MQRLRIGYDSNEDLKDFAYTNKLLSMYCSNISLVPFEAFTNENNNFTSGEFDKNTALGALAGNDIDTYLDLFVLSEERSKYMTFAIPSWYDRLCFYTQWREASKSRNLFFLDPLSEDMMLMIFVATLVCYVFRRAQKEFGVVLPFFLLQTNVQRPLEITAPLFIGLFSLLYNNLLRALFSDNVQGVGAFRTAAELATLIRNKEMQLYVDDYDYRLEILKASRSDYRSLYDALQANPPITAYGLEKICQRLSSDKKAVFMEQETGIRKEKCGRHFENVMKICPHNAPFVMGAISLRKGLDELTENYSRMIGFLYIDTLEKQRNKYVSERHYKRQPVAREGDHPIPLGALMIVFLGLLVGHGTSAVALVYERKLYYRFRHNPPAKSTISKLVLHTVQVSGQRTDKNLLWDNCG